jgi:hypothetical protein
MFVEIGVRIRGHDFGFGVYSSRAPVFSSALGFGTGTPKKYDLSECNLIIVFLGGQLA